MSPRPPSTITSPSSFRYSNPNPIPVSPLRQSFGPLSIMTSKGSGSGPPDGGSATPNPTSPSSTTTSPTTGAGAASNNSEKSSPNATSPTSKSGRKGKAVQWLDHHLNSQAAQERGLALQEQPQPQIIEDQLPSQAAAQLKHLRELEGLRLSEQEGQLNSAGRAQELGMELEGIRARERGAGEDH